MSNAHTQVNPEIRWLGWGRGWMAGPIWRRTYAELVAATAQGAQGGEAP